MVSPSPELIGVHGLGVRYGAEWVLRNAAFSLREKEIVSVIGPNGAGKSTLLKAMVGLVQPDEGEVMLHEGLSPAGIGYVPQQVTLDGSIPFTVREMLSLNLPGSPARFWWPGSAISSGTISEALEVMDAARLIDRRVGALSGGEFQRVMMAYSLLRNPSVLLLDEPLAGVDSSGVLLLEKLLPRLRDEKKLGIVLVSHDLHLAHQISDRVCCVDRGHFAVGSPHEILEEHHMRHLRGIGPEHQSCCGHDHGDCGDHGSH